MVPTDLPRNADQSAQEYRSRDGNHPSGISQCHLGWWLANRSRWFPKSADRPKASEYEVGFGKPPKKTQFKPGQSGNPEGRPKGAKNLKTELSEELQERVAVKEGGHRREVSKQRAMLKSLMAKAVHGDAKSASLVINMAVRLLDQSDSDDRSTPLSADDCAILEEFAAQLDKPKT